MDALFLKVLNMSIAGGWLILAVIVLRLLLKKAPKWLPCALWAVAALRLICPFSIESALSLIPSRETLPEELISSDTFNVQTGFDLIDAPVNRYLGGNYSEGVTVKTDAGSSVMETMGVIWTLGASAMLLYAAASYLRLRKKVGASLLLRDNIFICDDIDTPFILGVVKPRIYLPSAMEEEKQACVIAHERAHLKRRDNWWKPLGFAVLAVYWFSPLCWLAYILLCRDIELACDEKVIKSMEKQDLIAYSEALLTCSAEHRIVAASPLAFGEVGVKERIGAVLNYKKPAFWIVVAAVIVCIAVAVCFITDPKEESADAPYENTQQSAETLRFSSIVYINPASSYYPVGTTGYLYQIKENSFDIISEETGELYKSLPVGSWSWSPLSIEEWESLFVFVIDDAPDISGVNKPLMLKLSDRYYLFDMDVSLWLAEYGGEKNGMWSVYELMPDTTVQLPASAEAADPLDAAVSAAILEHNKSQSVTLDGFNTDFACESHVTLATERGGAAGSNVTDTVTVYAMVLYQEYSLDGKITEVWGGSCPTALTFDVTEGGGYVLREYWVPGDGSYYGPDILEKFPEDIAWDAMDTQKYILAQKQSCYEQAVEYGSIDTDAVISELLETIISSPKASSNPGDYIDEHPIEYRELKFYGSYTLDYCKRKLAEGGDTGLLWHIMTLVCEDIEK